VKHVRTFGKFWYDFIVGDDWRLAVGVTAAVALVAFLGHHDMNWWWVLPVVVTALLAVSLDHATRPRDR
jgi:hypothetical protein